ncbi:iripin-1-like isoform X2 [Convolutriloba macropyga]|uniref:iripin-1-like isoform X2 n=1 Tax=Convolutriloba macropyga TaxID=536237 RepID=UPI003F526CC3
MASKRNFSSAVFGHKLTEQFMQNCDQPNCVISPVSVFLCMSMLKRGANGVTEEEIDQVLGTAIGTQTEAIDLMKVFGQYSRTQFILSIANGLILQEGFEPLFRFVADLQTDFNASVKNVDFGSIEGVKKLNDWVSHATNRKINQIIDSPIPDTVMALINAVYMKGLWSKPFFELLTKKESFNTASNSAVETDIMIRTDYYEYIRNEEAMFSVAFLPYNCSSFYNFDQNQVTDWEMGILLPDENGNHLNFIKYLHHDALKKLRQKSMLRKLEVKFPKFKFESSIDLIPVLKRLGIKTSFTGLADYSKIRDGQLIVDTFLQKCRIEVDEEGTIATAVTMCAAAVLGSFVEPPVIKFHVKSPFLFFIYHPILNIVLFCGYVTNPAV